jgi:hypothetical protein
MQIVNLPLITGDGAAHPFSATVPEDAKWVQIVAESVASTSAPIRVGGASVSSSVGAPLYQQGASQFLPQDPTDLIERYHLLGMSYWAASGDKLSVMYAI